MAFDMKILDQTTWLADPAHVRRLAAQLVRIPTCPTAREVADCRKQRLEDARQAAAKAVRAQKGKIGVIGIYGPISQRLDAMSMKLGGTSTEEVGAAIDALVADPAVAAIVLHVDSPGGGSYGLQEVSDKIYAARERKKTYAIADSLAASAAYWLATSAETMVVTPGGEVGSVGVYQIHYDESKALEDEGIRVTMVSAGKYKTELSPYAPLSDSAREHVQTVVDDTHQRFLTALKRNRGVSIEHVRTYFGQGRVVGAEQALAAKMVDRVMTFDELLGRLTGTATSERKASMDVLRARHVLAKTRTWGG